MLEVSFYILPTASLAERDVFVCKLVEKVYRQGIHAMIWTASAAHSALMDEALWAYRANSFIPHQVLLNGVAGEVKQVLISAEQDHFQLSPVLINLSEQYPQQLQRFGRVLEILHQDDSTLAAGRDRFRSYQQAEAQLNTYKL